MQTLHALSEQITQHGITRGHGQLSASPLSAINPKDLISKFGIIGTCLIMFAETGLLIGFFLPGDSLLFLAGVATSEVGLKLVGERINLPLLLIGAPICAIIGAQLGHYLGARLGTKMFERPESRIFKRVYVEKAEYYFNKFGPAKAVLLARFIPIVRTFLNPVAGVLEMPARTFFIWNVIGGILWTDGVILAGHLLAGSIPASAIDKYLLPVIAVIVLLSVLPVLIEILRNVRGKRRRNTEAAALDDLPNADGESERAVSPAGRSSSSGR